MVVAYHLWLRPLFHNSLGDVVCGEGWIDLGLFEHKNSPADSQCAPLCLDALPAACSGCLCSVAAINDAGHTGPATPEVPVIAAKPRLPTMDIQELQEEQPWRFEGGTGPSGSLSAHGSGGDDTFDFAPTGRSSAGGHGIDDRLSGREFREHYNSRRGVGVDEYRDQHAGMANREQYHQGSGALPSEYYYGESEDMSTAASSGAVPLGRSLPQRLSTGEHQGAWATAADGFPAAGTGYPLRSNNVPGVNGQRIRTVASTEAPSSSLDYHSMSSSSGLHSREPAYTTGVHGGVDFLGTGRAPASPDRFLSEGGHSRLAAAYPATSEPSYATGVRGGAAFLGAAPVGGRNLRGNGSAQANYVHSRLQ